MALEREGIKTYKFFCDPKRTITLIAAEVRLGASLLEIRYSDDGQDFIVIKGSNEEVEKFFLHVREIEKKPTQVE